MEKCRFKIQGNCIEPEAIVDSLKLMTHPSQLELRKINNISIVLAESFYLRTASNLLTVIIINPDSENTYDLEVISGGGGQGIPTLNFGSELNELKKAKKILVSLCSDKGWTLEESKE